MNENYLLRKKKLLRNVKIRYLTSIKAVLLIGLEKINLNDVKKILKIKKN